MLKSPSKGMRWWTRAGLVSVWLVGCMASVTWTIRADEPLRVASLPKVKLAARLFANDVTRPWLSVGDAGGYMTVRPGQLLQDPSVKEFCGAADVNGQLEVFLPGIGANEIEVLQTNVTCNIAQIATDSADVEVSESGDTHSLTMGATSFAAEFSQPVDWTEVAGRVSAFPGLGEAGAKWLTEAMKQHGSSKKLCIKSGGDDADSEIVDRSHGLWGLVDGGSLTVLVPLQHIDWQLLKESLPQPVEQVALFSQIEAVAFGVDFDAATQQRHLRLAVALPADCNADQFMQDSQQQLDVALQAAKDSAATDENDSEAAYVAGLLADLVSLDMKLVQRDGESYVFATGPITSLIIPPL